MCNFWSNNYIEYESKGDRNKTAGFKEYLNEINTSIRLEYVMLFINMQELIISALKIMIKIKNQHFLSIGM